jgi:ribosomal protein S18 acetylase RimI-like enzyme
MNDPAPLVIAPYRASDQPHIRRILEKIGWDEPYILAFEQSASHFAASDTAAVSMAHAGAEAIGFVFVEIHAWNRLAQIQGLAVDPGFQRRGAAAALVRQAEAFARGRQARGIYVDTPITNEGGRRFYEAIGYRLGYIMPRYYEDGLDGVTYQKFFDGMTDVQPRK